MAQEVISEEVDRLYRLHYGNLTASLASFFRLPHLALAEDVVQSAFMAALKHWEQKGLPDDPVAWLYRTCRNKAINELRRAKPSPLKEDGYHGQGQEDLRIRQVFMDTEIRDNRLRLLFAACHPVFPPKARLILTLKTLGGLKAAEIARALNMTDDGVRRSLARTRATIRKENMPLHAPYVLQSQERLASVHHVLYLMFNEGYNASHGPELLRKELCLEAMRQTATLLSHKRIANQASHALYALMLFNAARFDSRTAPDGSLIELKEQDRSLWDRTVIREGISHFLKAKEAPQWTRYHFEAAIASLHASAPAFHTTDWQAILRLYEAYLLVDDSPFVRLNRALALHFTGETRQAINDLLAIEPLQQHPLLLTSLAELYDAVGRREDATNYYLDALRHTKNERVGEAIKKKLATLGNAENQTPLS